MQSVPQGKLTERQMNNFVGQKFSGVKKELSKANLKTNIDYITDKKCSIKYGRGVVKSVKKLKDGRYEIGVARGRFLPFLFLFLTTTAVIIVVSIFAVEAKPVSNTENTSDNNIGVEAGNSEVVAITDKETPTVPETSGRRTESKVVLSKNETSDDKKDEEVKSKETVKEEEKKAEESKAEEEPKEEPKEESKEEPKEEEKQEEPVKKLDCKPNTICYAANNKNATRTMDDQTIVYLEKGSNVLNETPLSSETTQLTLYAPNYALSGYGFKGWNTEADGSGRTYGPNETLELTPEQQEKLGSEGITMYAQWVASAGDMENWNGCSNLHIGDITALTYRSETYSVAKLVDGKCWMVENLRDTTIAEQTVNWTTNNADKQYNYSQITAGQHSPTAEGDYGWWAYGAYYTSMAATQATRNNPANKTNYDTLTDTYIANGTTVGVCPAGWRLPRSQYDLASNNEAADFSYLNYLLTGSYKATTALTVANWRTYPNNFVLSGAFSYGSPEDRGTSGFYWSSTSSSNVSNFELYLRSSYASPIVGGGKFHGMTVRCVLNQ